MLKRCAALALIAGLSGCSLESAGIAEEFDMGDAADSSAGGDVIFPVDDGGDDTLLVDDTGGSVPEDSGGADSTLLDTDVDMGVDTGVDTGPLDTGVDTGPLDTGTPDTGALDTGSPDTGTLDTGTADTGTLDSGSPDTGTLDTGVMDSGPLDTGLLDTGLLDTGVEVGDATLGPSLTGEISAVSGGTITLSTEGTLGWAHWGHEEADRFNRRSASPTAISNVTAAGTGLQRFFSYPLQFSWTGGTPNGTVSNTNDGIYLDASGQSFTFDAAGDPLVERTLRIYATWNNATGRVDANLNDASATWTGNIPPTGDTGFGNQPVVIQLKFRPATATGRVVVKLSQTNSGTARYISLLAATLK